MAHNTHQITAAAMAQICSKLPLQCSSATTCPKKGAVPTGRHDTPACPYESSMPALHQHCAAVPGHGAGHRPHITKSAHNPHRALLDVAGPQV